MPDSIRLQAEQFYHRLQELDSSERGAFLEENVSCPEFCAEVLEISESDSHGPDESPTIVLTEHLEELCATSASDLDDSVFLDLPRKDLNLDKGEEEGTANFDSGAGEKYPRRRELGRGGMGAVYEVWDSCIERPLALKMILPQGGREGDKQVARFLKEAQITGQIDHPGVVPVHEIARDALGRVYFTMQVVEGQSLREILKLSAEARAAEGWSFTRLLDVILKVCETLAYAHSKGFIHRDLKPANIMVGQFGETYVMDWGLAKKIGEDDSEERDASDHSLARAADSDSESEGERGDARELTRIGTVLGTPAYMPPEQASGGAVAVEFGGDVFAVGAMLYEILAGHPPYHDLDIKKSHDVLEAVRNGPPTKLERLAPRMPTELLSISEKAMMRERSARYEGMDEMGDDVRAYLENRVVSAHRTGAIAELTKWIRRNRGVAATALVALGVAITALVVVSLLNIDLTSAKNETDLALVEKGQALVEKNDALVEKTIAFRYTQGLVLAGESFKILESNPGSALLLALEASELASGPAVNEAILNALERIRELVTYPDHCRKFPHDNFLAMNQAGTILAGASETHEVYLADVATGRRTAVCVGHVGAINYLAFDPAGDRLLSTSDDETVRLWEVSTGRLLGVLPGHVGGAASAIFHPRKNLVASLSKSGMVRLWDLSDPKGEPTTWRADDKVRAKVIRFSPEGQHILVGCDDGRAWLVDHSTMSNPMMLGRHLGGVSVVGFSSTGQFFTVAQAKLKGERGAPIETDCRLWSADGKLISLLSSGESLVTVAAFSGDGRTIVTGAKDGSVRAWNTETGDLIALVQEPEAGPRVSAVEPNADGSLVAIGGMKGEVVMRDVMHDGSSGVIRARFQGHSKWVKALRFGPGEEWILTSAQDNTIRRWRVHDRSALPTLAAAGPASKIEFQAAGVGLLTQTDDGMELALWEVPGGKRKRNFVVKSPVLQSSLSHDGKHLWALHEDGTISQWDTLEETPPRTFQPEMKVSAMKISNDDRFLLVTSTETGVAQRLDLVAGTWEKNPLEVGRSIALTFSGEGDRLIVRQESGTELWNMETRSKMGRITEGPGVNVKVPPQGHYLATYPFVLSEAGKNWRFCVLLWDLETGQRVGQFPWHENRLMRVKFDPSGDYLVTSSVDKPAKLWNCSDGSLLASFFGHGGEVEGCWVSRGGRRVLTRCYSDGSTRLWDGESGEEIATLGQNVERVSSLSFSSRGNYVTATFSKEAAIWSAEEGKLITRLPAHKTKIKDLEICDNEQWVATLTMGGAVRIWPIDPAPYARKFAPRELTPAERELYQVGTKEERVREAGRWTSAREREVLMLYEKGLDGTAQAMARIRPSYLRSVKSICDALHDVDEEEVTLAEEELLASLKTIGKSDLEAHLSIVRMQSDLKRARLGSTLERTLALPNLSSEVIAELKDLKQQHVSN